MCHSPSGAFRVQAPVRAPWAVADAATATLSPAAIPPDSTFCVKRFITDLRMKGGSTALLHSIATCCMSQAASAGTAETATGLECRSWKGPAGATYRLAGQPGCGWPAFGHRAVPALAAGEGSP